MKTIIRPQFISDKILERLVIHFLNHEHDSETSAIALISTVPNSVKTFIENSTETLVRGLVAKEIIDDIIYLSENCTMLGLYGLACGAQAYENNLEVRTYLDNFESADDICTAGEEALGFEYNPDRCDTCKAGETCDPDVCVVTARHNKLIWMLRWQYADPDDQFFEETQSHDAEQIEFYKAFFLFGLVLYKYYEDHTFCVENERNLYTSSEPAYSKDYSKLNRIGLLGKEVSAAALAGHNYYHYIDGEYVNNERGQYLFPDLDIALDDEHDELNDDLEQLLPKNCWLKQYPDRLSSTERHIIYLVLDGDWKVRDFGYIKEEIQVHGGGFIMIPGMELPSTKTYTESNYIPWFAEIDLKNMVARPMPLDYSFINQKLPQRILDHSVYAESNKRYRISIQSAHRSAITHLIISTNEDGIVEDMSYATYQSSGSLFTSMMTRPIPLHNREDEALHALLEVYNSYTAEEFENIQ